MNPDFELASYQVSVRAAQMFLIESSALLDEMLDEVRSMARGLDVERAEHAREVGVLTAERDAALLRVEELEWRVSRLQGQVIEWSVYKGGVNPNA